MGFPAIGLALKGATLLGGGAMIGDTVQGLSQWGGKRTREINNMSDQEFADYNPSLIDQYVLGQGSREQASGRRDAFITDKAKDSPEYRQLLSEGIDLKVNPGDDINDILASNAGAIRQGRNAIAADDVKAKDLAQWNSQGARYEREQTAQNRNDLLLAAERTRADNQQIRLEDIEARRAREDKEDRRYNERIMQMNTADRRAAMSSLGAGLAALGAAFAL